MTRPKAGADGPSIPPLDEAHFRPARARVRRPFALHLLLILDSLMVLGLVFVLVLLAMAGLSGGIGHPSPKDDSQLMFWVALVFLGLHIALWIGLARNARWLFLLHVITTGVLVVGTLIRPLGRDWPAMIPVALGLLSLGLLVTPASLRWFRSNRPSSDA